MKRMWGWRCGPTGVALIALLLASVVLRLAMLPARHDLRDVDEPDYLQGGLLLLEGLPPSYHYAPAGPETWVSWLYGGAAAARYFLLPTAEESQVPAQVRVYTAVNHALFDIYRDMSGLRLTYILIAATVSVCAVAAAYRLGLRWGGPQGAVLCGGLVAFTPLLADMAVEARPYSIAWSCVVIATCVAAARPGASGALTAGALAGLAVASRVEMLTLLPLVVLARRDGLATWRAAAAEVLRVCAAAAVTALLVAPWLLTNLLGNLRAIATLRFGPLPNAAATTAQTLADFGWVNGLGVACVLFLFAVVQALWRWREPDGRRRVLLYAYVLLALVPMLRATGFGMRHQGPSIMALLLGCALVGTARAAGRWRAASWALVGLAVLLPLAQSVRLAAARRTGYVPDRSIAWVNANVPPGTIAYVTPTLNELLPTTESADAMWDMVMSRQAAVEKFNSGLSRLRLGTAEMPRALSEQHMVVERSRVRRWFILGSRAHLAGPRFDIRRYGNSGVAAFSVHNPVPLFKKTGGILIWRDVPLPASEVGEPVVMWVNADGVGTRVYCSADLRDRLRSP